MQPASFLSNRRIMVTTPCSGTIDKDRHGAAPARTWTGKGARIFTGTEDADGGVLGRKL
jgi:hypothetical protein